MTFEEYIKNPMGSSVMSNRSMYQQMYSTKWDNLKVRENGLILRTLYQDKNDYYIHFKIPSEVVEKFYYDTIIRFYLDKKSGITPNSLSDYQVQFFSNDPSFVFTFAYSFKKNDLLIKDLEFKMSPIALKEKAIEKNPKNEVGYVKSLYFAYLEMKHSGLFAKVKWEKASKKYSKDVWKTTVEHADDKVRDRQEQGVALSKKEKRENNKEKNEERNNRSQSKFNTIGKSPNQPGFGHFKKEDFNVIAKAKSNIGKSIGKIKKKPL